MYCGDKCKQDGWALRRVADLIFPLPVEKKLEILAAASGHEIKAKPTEIHQAKTYKCIVWPRLNIGKHIRFEMGVFKTKDPELQKSIESNEAFGAQIRLLSE